MTYVIATHFLKSGASNLRGRGGKFLASCPLTEYGILSPPRISFSEKQARPRCMRAKRCPHEPELAMMLAQSCRTVFVAVVSRCVPCIWLFHCRLIASAHRTALMGKASVRTQKHLSLIQDTISQQGIPAVCLPQEHAPETEGTHIPKTA